MNKPRWCVRWLISITGLLVSANGLLADETPDPFRPPAITTDNVPPIPSELRERLLQYQNVRTAGFRGWSPDGKGLLILTRFGNTAQVHRVYEPGSRREQITFFDEPAAGTFIPKALDGAILITMSRGGNENEQVYLLDPTTGRASLLTDGKSRNLLNALSDDGRRMIVGSNLRNGRDTDLYLGDPRKPGSLKMLFQTDGEYWTVQDWSPDGTRVLMDHYVSINESYPALLDVRTGKRTPIPIPGGVKASFGALEFSNDGRHAYVATDARSEFQQLARVDLETFEYRWLAEDIPWDVTSIEADPATGRVAFTVNEDGASALYFLEGDKPRRVNLPLGVIAALEFSPDGKQLGFALAAPNAPTDVYSLDVETHALTRWTYSEVGGLDASKFITPQRIAFPSFDGREIPAYYFKPRGASPSARAAVLISIHGGPESQYRPLFSGINQFYVNELGIAVICPNVRGSSGYGKTYLQLDNAEKREDSVRDIGALLDWIARQPELDATRVAVSGGSYGGYMVLGSLTNFGNRIKAGIDIVGIASFESFLKNTSAYRQDLRRAEYGDERDPAMLNVFKRIDPIHNAHKIESALLVAHGKNDPRVPFTEAEKIAPVVRSNGREVWTVYADNEGHGFAKKDNNDYLTAAIAMFLQQQLK